MFHIRLLKNRFKLPVSDYNKIAEFLNNICGGLGINVKRPEKPSATNPPMIEVDRKDLEKMVYTVLDPEPEESTNHEDDGTAPVQNGDDESPWTWPDENSEGRLVFDAYCLTTKPSQNSSYHDLRRVRLTFSKGGLLVKAEMQPDGIRIRA